MRPFAVALVTVLATGLSSGVARVARADDKADCIAAFEASQSLRAAGKLTEAIPKFAICARDVCPRSMQKVCVDQASEAAAQLPTVVLVATDASQNALVDVTASIDGVVVATVLDGKAIPVDPGIHTFRFEREGVPPVEHRTAVKEGQKGQMISVRLGAADLAPPVAAPMPVVPGAPIGAAPAGSVVLAPAVSGAPAPPPPHRGSVTVVSITRERWLALGLAGAGVVGVAVGGLYAELAAAKWTDAKAECGSSCGPASVARNTQSKGETYATGADVAFATGLVLVGGGVALWVVGGPKRAETAVVTPTLGGLSLSGTFR